MSMIHSIWGQKNQCTRFTQVSRRRRSQSLSHDRLRPRSLVGNNPYCAVLKVVVERVVYLGSCFKGL